MNKLAKRAWFAYFLAAAMFVGLIVILVRYAVSAPDWITNYAVGAPDRVRFRNDMVVDRSGTMLMDYTDEKSELADDEAVRAAMIHILGDTQGNIPSYMLNAYAGEMSGYDRLTGIRHVDGSYGKMQLTVSAFAQKAAVNAFGDQKGTIGVYNYKTGEILCMVSFPNYDPHNMPDIADDPDAYDGVYVNRFLHSAYTPGSTFKLVTAAAALAEIDDIKDRTFHCEGSALIGDEVVICNHSHGDIGFNEALCQSCNVAFAHIAQELGAERLSKYADRIGIGSSLSFDGFITKKGNFDLSSATTFEAAWAGVGQYTDQINLCQYMTFVGAIANGGEAALPYLVENVRFGTEIQYQAERKTGGRILDPQVAADLADMMHYNVANNYHVYVGDCFVGAKSGTAERGAGLNPDALFAGFVRSEEYPLAFVVIVEGGGEGSTTCAPIIQQVLDACIVAIDS